MTKLVLASAAALGLSVAAASAATITIDDFSVAQGPVVATPGTTASDTLVASGAIGPRTITSVGNGPIGETVGEVIVVPPFQFLSVANDPFSTGTVTVSYDLGGMDLSDSGANDSILVGVQSIDLNGLFTVSVDGVAASQVIDTVGNLTFGGLDGALGSVNTLSFVVDSNGVDAFDGTFTFFSVEDLEPNATVVPLPAGVLLLGTALLGLGFARRKS